MLHLQFVSEKKDTIFVLLLRKKVNKAQQQHSSGQKTNFPACKIFLNGINPRSSVKVMCLWVISGKTKWATFAITLQGPSSDTLIDMKPTQEHNGNVSSLSSFISLVLPRGVVTTPLTVCLRPHKNAKESDPGHLRHLFYILCGDFDETNPGVPPKMGVGWAVKVRR